LARHARPPLEESNTASAMLAARLRASATFLSACRLEADDAVYAPELRVIAGG